MELDEDYCLWNNPKKSGSKITIWQSIPVSNTGVRFLKNSEQHKSMYKYSTFLDK
jgi:hypothetical protein